MKLDEKDIALLNEFQKNCRQSLKKLARKLDMSITTVHDKIKKYEKEGIIRGCKSILDPEKVGKPFLAFIMIQVDYSQMKNEEKIITQRELAKRISMLPDVLETYIVAGEFDIIIKVRGRDVKELGEVVIDKLRNIKGVGRTLTHDVWVTVKESTEIDIRQHI